MNYEKFLEAREALRQDVRACLDLQHQLGLRRSEAVMAGASLREWARDLETARQEGRGAFLNVVQGCKGGRERCTWVPQERVEHVLDAVLQAREIARTHSGGHIIDAADLEAAKTVYSNHCYRAGLTGDNSGHGLRRAFAQGQLVRYREDGQDERAALARVSRDLGHGDGRGRWVHNNYVLGGEG